MNQQKTINVICATCLTNLIQIMNKPVCDTQNLIIKNDVCYVCD